MINYIKSEFYRIFHSKEVYLFTAGCSGLLVLMNLVFWRCSVADPGFRYGKTSFSYSFISYYMGMILIVTALFASMIITDEFKFRTMNNSIAFGLSKTTLYLAKVVVALAVAILCFVVIVGVLVISGYLLLENSGPQALRDLLISIVVCMPSLMAGLIGIISLYFICGSMTAGNWTWLAIVAGTSMICSMLARKFAFFAGLSKWLIYSVVSDVDNWATPEGIRQCVLAGVLGCIAFLAVGIIGTEKKEM